MWLCHLNTTFFGFRRHGVTFIFCFGDSDEQSISDQKKRNQANDRQYAAELES